MKTTELLLIRRPGKKGFVYTVRRSNDLSIPESGPTMSVKRYLACTADRKYFFESITDIGKGAHGKAVENAKKEIVKASRAVTAAVVSHNSKDFEIWSEKLDRARLKLRNYERIAYNVTDINENSLSYMSVSILRAMDHRDKRRVREKLEHIVERSLLDEVGEVVRDYWNVLIKRAQAFIK